MCDRLRRRHRRESQFFFSPANGPPYWSAAGWEQVTVTEDSVCALDSNRQTSCWGSGYFGVPSGTPSFTGMTEIVGAGREAHCGLDSAGHLGCWGGLFLDTNW